MLLELFTKVGSIVWVNIAVLVIVGSGSVDVIVRTGDEIGVAFNIEGDSVCVEVSILVGVVITATSSVAKEDGSLLLIVQPLIRKMQITTASI